MSPRPLIGLALAGMALPLVSPAQIVDDFAGGHGPAPGGAYSDEATGGWTTPWLPKRIAASTGVDRDIVDIAPLVPRGSRYLTVSGVSTNPGVWGIARQYAAYPNREYNNVRRDRAHIIRFNLRIDELSGWSRGEDFAIGDAQSAVENNGLGPLTSFAIRVHYGDTGSARSNFWALYDGNRDGSFQNTRYVDTGIPLTVGVTYTFTVRLIPSTRSWIASIDDGTHRFTSGMLGYRAGGLGTGVLTFFRSTNATTDATAFSVDNIRIDQGE